MAKATTMKTLHNAPYSGGSNSKAPNYDINYDDKRFQKVEDTYKTETTNNQAFFDKQAATSDAAYDKAIDGISEYEQKMVDAQNENTELAIEKLETAQERTRQDYIKEQAGAYADWQKQSNPYGANAEAMASQGLTNTGYSESSQVAMYNQYQNRVAIARQSFERASADFEMGMAEARAQNSAALAEIYWNAYKEKAALSIQKIVANQDIWTRWLNQQNVIDNRRDTNWQRVLDQINTENTLAETVRQHNLSYDLQKRAIALDEAKFAYQKQQDAKKATVSSGGGSSGGSSSKGSSSGSSSKGSSTVNKNTSTSVKGDTKKETTKEPTIDSKSVLALGYGPISGAKLNELESQGIIKSYVQDGKIKFTKAKLGTAGVKGKTTMKNFGY